MQLSQLGLSPRCAGCRRSATTGPRAVTQAAAASKVDGSASPRSSEVKQHLSSSSALEKEELQQSLSSSTSAEEVLLLLDSRLLQRFDHIHAATALQRLATFSGSARARRTLSADPRLQQLFSHLTEKARLLNAQGFANVLWALAKLTPEVEPPSALVSSLLLSATKASVWADARPQAVANAAYALGKLYQGSEATPPAVLDLMNLLSKTPIVQLMKPQEISNYAWSYAVLELSPTTDGWGKSLWAAFGEQLQRFSALELSICLYALAKLKCKGEAAEIAAAATQMGRLASQADSQAVANGLWALATLRGEESVPREPLSLLLQRSVELSAAEEMPKALCITLWACASLDFDPGPAVVSKLSTRALSMAPLLVPKDLIQIAGGLSALGYAPGPKAMMAFQAACTASKGRLTPDDRSFLIHCCAAWGIAL